MESTIRTQRRMKRRTLRRVVSEDDRNSGPCGKRLKLDWLGSMSSARPNLFNQDGAIANWLVATVGCTDVAVAKTSNRVFLTTRLARLIGSEDPAFCIWELSEGITAEKFQAYIDSPNGVNIG